MFDTYCAAADADLAGNQVQRSESVAKKMRSSSKKAQKTEICSKNDSQAEHLASSRVSREYPKITIPSTSESRSLHTDRREMNEK